MKKLLLLSLVFLLASCNTGDAPSSLSQGNQNTPITVDTGDYAATLEAISPKIKETPEFNSCVQASISMCTQSTAMQIAEKTKSAEFCNELATQEQKESCRYAVAMTQMQETKDEKYCDTLSGNFQKTCINQAYVVQAMAAKDASICDKITAPEILSGAINNASGPERGQCIMNVILVNQDSKVSDCEKIGDEALENMCKVSIEQRVKMTNPPVNLPPTTPLQPTGTSTTTSSPTITPTVIDSDVTASGSIAP